jgi:hypothetical protein
VIIRPRFRRALAFILAVTPPVILLSHAATSQASDKQPLNLPVVAPILDCPAMTSADASKAVGAGTVVASAAVVDDGKSAAYCKLQIVVDDYAKFELHLPVSAWTQRLLFGGGPGAQVGRGGSALDQFATVSWQDLGHRGQEDVFARNYDAANFVQGPARPAPADLSNWFGSDFYTPHLQK